MATTKSRKRRKRKLTFQEKSKIAWELVRAGRAANLKEAWAIIKQNGA